MRVLLLIILVFHLNGCFNSKQKSCETIGVIIDSYHIHSIRGAILQGVEYNYNYNGEDFHAKEKFPGNHFMFHPGDSVLIEFDCKKPLKSNIVERTWNSEDTVKQKDKESKFVKRTEENTSKGISYYVVDKKPLFYNAKNTTENDSVLNTYFKRKIISYNINENGVVTLSLIINEKGEVEDYNLIKHASNKLDSIAIEIVEDMPKWIPGENNGKKVKVNYLVEFKF